MIVYFADRRMNILGQASTNLPKGIVIKEDTKSEEIETGVSVFECRFAYSKETRGQIEQWTEAGNYILRSSDSESEFYTIISVEIDTENQDIYIYAEDAGMDLLNEVLKSSNDGVARSLKEYIENAAYDSGFEIGINESDNAIKTYYALDEQTVSERILYISEKFGYEISYSFSIKRLEVTHKYINIYEKRGKDTGVQLRLNREIEKIMVKKSVENLATSLLCVGSADASGVNISLEGYPFDDGDFYTSGRYLNSRNALAKWSRYLWHKEPNQINNVGHIVRIFTYDTVSKEELCKKAVEELKKICDIERNYEVQITHLPDNVKIGDILNIVDDAGNLYLQSRLLKLETSVVANTRTATLGDYLIQDDGISERVEQLATQFKDLAKNQALYTWIVYADDSFGNGITLEADGKDWIGIIENQVSKDADLDNPSIYKWSRIGGYPGEPGDAGTDGISVIAIEDQYYLSTSSEEVVNGSWQDGIPDWERGKYIWKRYKVTWSDDSITYTNAELDRALNHANEAADLADQKAVEAEEAASSASIAAQNSAEDADTAAQSAARAKSFADEANRNASDAKEIADTAQGAADAANVEVTKINNEISTIKDDAAELSTELNGKITTMTETMEASYAKKTDVSTAETALRAEISRSAAEIKTTMSSDYAKKTDLTDVQADLQTQVTQNATDITFVASSVETVQIDASTAQKNAEEARKAASSAQTTADSAVSAASVAKTAADTAMQAAENAHAEAKNAQTAADTAVKSASDADAVAKAAQKDLDTAKANLTAVTNRVDATEDDIAAAQLAVSNAQTAADNAKTSAAKAKSAAESAQTTADTAKANALTAQSTANTAQIEANDAKALADNAQKSADEASKAVGELGNKVITMSTKIDQNAEAITLAATKKEVTDKLAGYPTTTQMDSAIELSKTGILSMVSSTYSTKTEVNNVKTTAEQTANKFNWIVKSGTSSTDFTLTDRVASLLASQFNVDALVTFKNSVENGTSTVINGGAIKTGTITADKIDVNSIFAKNITATGTITGAKLVGATGSFTGSINATSGIFSCGNDYGQTVDIRDGRIWMNDVETQVILNGNGLYVQSKGGHNYAYVAQDGIYTETELTVAGNISAKNVTCTDVTANGWAYVGQLHFKQNSSANYISIGNYNGWNNYYYSAGYHAFYCGGNGIAYIRSDGISMGNYDIMCNLGHGIKYGSEWILRPYKSGDYNVTALGNGNRRTVLYGSQVRLNSSTGTTVSSDRRLKKDFANFDKRYEKFFMSLKPQTYKMAYTKNSEEYKITNGFIAQDVEESLGNAGIDPMELDLISCETADKEFLNEMFNGHPPGIQKQYSLNYSGFISLNTYMIQKNTKELVYQEGKIDLHETIINDLQNRLWQAEKEIEQLKEAA